ncbi:hypothetical protein GWI33_021244 [Rhynchophorus ferrugineus]|uniref:Uncharacterized protein n=1 Tax=Rhynchophorus ferrugineus TaxID=354439 RepID=A0A834M2K0_RHYFE|nr:hypothetical protein GWI33_021244 [Rhynchophorus ferrugineus]
MRTGSCTPFSGRPAAPARRSVWAAGRWRQPRLDAMEAAVASSTTQADAESSSESRSRTNADSTFASVKQEPGSNPDSPLEASSPSSIAIRAGTPLVRPSSFDTIKTTPSPYKTSSFLQKFLHLNPNERTDQKDPVMPPKGLFISDTGERFLSTVPFPRYFAGGMAPGGGLGGITARAVHLSSAGSFSEKEDGISGPHSCRRITRSHFVNRP